MGMITFPLYRVVLRMTWSVLQIEMSSPKDTMVYINKNSTSKSHQIKSGNMARAHGIFGDISSASISPFFITWVPTYSTWTASQ